MRDEEREKNHRLAIARVKEVEKQISKVLTKWRIGFEKQAGGMQREWVRFEIPEGPEIRVDIAWKHGYGRTAGSPTGGVRVKVTRHCRTLNRYPPAKDGFPKMKRLLKDLDSLGAQLKAEREKGAREEKLDAEARTAQGKELGFAFPDGILVSHTCKSRYKIEIDRLRELTSDEVVRIIKVICPGWKPEVKA